MNKKGFTLIELLAVIVILAIIALIAVPIVLGIIEDSRKSATLRSAENYLRGVEQAVARAMLNGNTTIDPNGTYSINDNGDICLDESCSDPLKVEVDGEKPSAGGTITLKDGSISSATLKLNSKDIELKEGKLDYKKQESTGGSNNTSVCTYVDSKEYENTVGEIDRNDIVTCGTESFYVIDNDGENVTMLSMYNLNIGDTKYPNEDTYGIQDEHVRGVVLNSEGTEADMTNSFGMIAFSTSNYWHDTTNDVLKSEYGESYPAWVYIDTSRNIDPANNLYTHVSSYETYLKEELKVTSANASIISYEKLDDLGCKENYCSNMVGGVVRDGNAPAWVFLTSYWSGIASDNSYIKSVTSSGEYNDLKYSKTGICGIRPLVTISVEEFNN